VQDRKSPVSTFGDDLVLYDLKRLPKTAPELLAMIPSGSGGVYAFFLPLAPTGFADSSSTTLSHAFAAQIKKPRFPSRQANLPPSHAILLKSRVRLPEPKRAALEAALALDHFRDYLSRVLHYDFLFSSPLYIGKADSFRARLQEHLDGTSGLRAQLHEHGIQLSHTKLLLLTVPTRDTSAEPPTDTNTDTSMQNNLLMEDLISRLALPGFTRRIG
jgi:hypothetical protein